MKYYIEGNIVYQDKLTKILIDQGYTFRRNWWNRKKTINFTDRYAEFEKLSSVYCYDSYGLTIDTDTKHLIFGFRWLTKNYTIEEVINDIGPKENTIPFMQQNPYGVSISDKMTEHQKYMDLFININTKQQKKQLEAELEKYYTIEPDHSKSNITLVTTPPNLTASNKYPTDICGGNLIGYTVSGTTGYTISVDPAYNTSVIPTKKYNHEFDI